MVFNCCFSAIFNEFISMKIKWVVFKTIRQIEKNEKILNRIEWKLRKIEAIRKGIWKNERR